MPSELEQYLFDHQFDFLISEESSGCLECEANDYSHYGPYGKDVPGHERGCSIAVMLVQAGFDVPYHAAVQGCPTLQEYERTEWFSHALQPSLALMKAEAGQYYFGDTIRILKVADVQLSVYQSNDAPMPDRHPEAPVWKRFERGGG